MTINKDEHEHEHDRLRGRSVRVEDELWEAAHEACRWRGDPNLSFVIRRFLVKYVKDTDQRKRNGERGRA